MWAPGMAASSIQIDGAMAAGSHLQVDSIGSFKVGVPLDDAAPNPFAASDPSDGGGNSTHALIIGVAVLALVGAAVAGGMALSRRPG